MKSLKSLRTKGVLGSIRRKTSGLADSTDSAANGPSSQTPEQIAKNSVRAFCEAGNNVKGDEVLFLPPIVDAAESSPAAAAEAARQICKFLSKDYVSRPAWQYNALMLLRILVDNPGVTFTRSLDDKLVDSARHILKHTKDKKVRQLLMEILDEMDHLKANDDNLQPLVLMWKEVKTDALSQHGGYLPPRRTPFTPPSRDSQNYFSRHHHHNRLPDPAELTSRLEEARTSAKLLEQVVMNTPPAEILHNDLIKEFADRCLSASRSIQGYMHANSPSPDNETMESLIDTNEQLQTALSQHQRAVLNVRKAMGLGERSASATGTPNLGTPVTTPPLPARPIGNGKGKETASSYSPPDGPPPGRASSSGQGALAPNSKGKGVASNLESMPQAASGSGSGSSPAVPPPDEDPFADPSADSHDHYSSDQLHVHEPYHPGFTTSSSYVGRQNSAVGKLTMHGAESQGDSSEKLAPGNQATADDDIYEATPKSKKPVDNSWQ